MNINFNNIVENNSEITLYKKKYNEIISYLTVFGKSDFWTIVRNVGGSERRMMRLLEEMKKEGIIEIRNNSFKLPNEKAKYNYDINEIKKTMKNIMEYKPKATFLFDQRPVTLNTTIKRVEHLLNNNDVYKKEIIFLGDDDLTGLCLALTGVDCNITIFDIDERLIDFIQNISNKYNLNINAHVFNVLNDVENEYLHKYDILFTDPTPEVIPFTVFMNTAINLVKKNTGIIYTSIYSSAMEKTRDLQDVIFDMRLYISEMIPKFTEYQAIYELYKNNDIEFINKYNIPYDENSICFYETQFRLEVCPDTKLKKISYKSSDIFGKATKMVLKDKNKDLSSDEYLDNIFIGMSKNSSKIYNSGGDL